MPKSLIVLVQCLKSFHDKKNNTKMTFPTFNLGELSSLHTVL